MVYNTTLTTPADTPIAITGELVMLLTDNTNTLLVEKGGRIFILDK